MFIIYKDYPITGEWWYFLGEKSINDINKELNIPEGTPHLLSTNYVEDSIYSSAYDLDWNLENGSVSSLTFDKSKGIEIFLNIMRKIREPLFIPLDIAYMQALESGNQTTIQNVVTQKQELRNCTDIDFTNANDLNDIKSLWPDGILGSYPTLIDF